MVKSTATLKVVKYYIPSMGLKLEDILIQADREENRIYVEMKEKFEDNIQKDVLDNVICGVKETIEVDSKFDVSDTTRELYRGILIITIPVSTERMTEIGAKE